MPISSISTTTEDKFVPVKRHTEEQKEVISQDNNNDNTIINEVVTAPELSLQQQLEEIEIVKTHVADSENWTRRIAHAHVSDENRVHHFTAGILRGEKKLGISPALFQSKDERQILIAIPNLPGRSGFTANLNINYRHPCIANQFVVIHSELASLEGRKANVKATLKSLDGTLLADATALYIAPKIAIPLLTEQLTQIKSASSETF
ncbi:hypothetical protein BGZ46_005449 [Entomortierella lignicola]|nr:hypothetical protein BGZ46_005449 [Entomortierella lignicola]